MHSTPPTKFLVALDLNLPLEEGDREAIPDLNGDVEEAQDPGGDCAQQDHMQGGGNPADGVERDVDEGGNPAHGVQGDVHEEAMLQFKSSPVKIWEEATRLFIILISTINQKL
jgi:hypothetical protein